MTNTSIITLKTTPTMICDDETTSVLVVNSSSVVVYIGSINLNLTNALPLAPGESVTFSSGAKVYGMVVSGTAVITFSTGVSEYGALTSGGSSSTNVYVTNFPTTQNIAGSVNVGNFPSTQAISAASLPLPTGAATAANQQTDALTNTQLRASNVPVTVANFPVTQPISGSVSVSNFPATQDVILNSGGSLVGQQTSAASLPVVVASDQKLPVINGDTASTTVTITGNTTSLLTLTTTNYATAVIQINANGYTGSGNLVFTFQGKIGSGTFQAIPSLRSSDLGYQSGNQNVGQENVILYIPCEGFDQIQVGVAGYSAGGANPIVIAVGSAATHTIGATVSGTVGVNNFPATQNVDITSQSAGLAQDATVSGLLTNTQLRASAVPVNVSNFPAMQVVSGTVTANQGGSWTVQSNQGTAAALSGAWPVGVTDGTNLLGTSSHPLRTDPTGSTTQPVSVASSVAVTQSGAWAVTANAGTNLNTSALALESGGNLAAAKSDLDSIVTNTTGLSTSANQTNGNQKTQVTNFPTNQQVVGAAADGSAAAGNPVLVGFLDNSGNVEVPDLTTAGALKVDASATTQPISGTVSATQSGSWSVGTATASVNVNQTTSNTTAVQLNSGSIASTNGILVQAISTNTASVYIGGSGVTTTTGFELQPGQAVPFTVSNITSLYVIGSNNTDKVCWNVL